MNGLQLQCKSCKHDWDGHCVAGNDNWKAMVSGDVVCEDFRAKHSDAFSNVPTSEKGEDRACTKSIS